MLEDLSEEQKKFIEKYKKCKHEWVGQFHIGLNGFDDIALFEIWKCEKCGSKTTGEFKGVLMEHGKNKALKERIDKFDRKFADV